MITTQQATSNTPRNQERAIPILRVPDLDKEAAFYAWLGLGVLHRYDGYLILGNGDLEIHLAHWDSHDPVRTAVYFRVTDAQAIYDRLHTELERDDCLDCLHEIEDKPWGLREFSVIDPNGNTIRIGHLLSASTEEPAKTP